MGLASNGVLRRAVLALLVGLVAGACRDRVTPPVENPPPRIQSLSPETVTAGTPGLTLSIRGAGFIAGSTARWNGSIRATSFVSSTQLTVLLTSEDLKSAGTAEVTVLNPQPGGGLSNAAALSIRRLVDRVEIARNYPSAFVGDTTLLAVTLIGMDGDTLASGAIHWSSDDPDVASVTQDGVIHGMVPGVARIEASSGGAVGSVEVTILARRVRSNQEIAYLRSTGVPSTPELRILMPGQSSSALLSGPDEYVTEVAWSPDGQRIVITYSGTVEPGADSYVVAADGSGRHSLGAYLWSPNWSPDGSKLAYRNYISTGESDVYTMRVDGSDRRQLTSGPGDDLEPKWSPDGRQIAYLGAVVGGHGELRLMAADGSDPRTLDLPNPVMRVDWSPDGKHLAYSSGDGIWIVNSDGTGLRPLTRNCALSGRCTPAGQFDVPAWSPDGARLAYSRVPVDGDCYAVIVDADGTNEVRIGAGDCSAFAFTLPQWSPDGTRLVFQSQNPGRWPSVSQVNADGSDRRYLTGAENAYWGRWRP
jgi:Tol biopolymer transport system component